MGLLKWIEFQQSLLFQLYFSSGSYQSNVWFHHL